MRSEVSMPTVASMTKLLAVQGHDIWLMRVEGITSPEQASTLRNHRLLMLLSDCPDLADDDEFYSWELVGMQVPILYQYDHQQRLKQAKSVCMGSFKITCAWLSSTPEHGQFGPILAAWQYVSLISQPESFCASWL